MFAHCTSLERFLICTYMHTSITQESLSCSKLSTFLCSSSSIASFCRVHVCMEDRQYCVRTIFMHAHSRDTGCGLPTLPYHLLTTVVHACNIYVLTYVHTSTKQDSFSFNSISTLSTFLCSSSSITSFYRVHVWRIGTCTCN